MSNEAWESVVVSSRIRLARNFKDYPFPARLICAPHASEQASEMIRIVAGELMSIGEFRLYVMKDVSQEEANSLKEQYLISRDLIRHSAISAALISKDETISVMVNEEDHIRAQCFMKGYDLLRAYERISGIDEIISDSIPFAYDEQLGYLTACPTNLGTGLRASAMLFLPAMSRRGFLKQIMPRLMSAGLTVRGVYGEGSAGEGDLFQISNELTLGKSEEQILETVRRNVEIIADIEIAERGCMKEEGGLVLKDKIFRAYGTLCNAVLLSEKECASLISDLKLGVALGYFGDEKLAEGRMRMLDDIAVDMRPANVMWSAGMAAEEQDSYRAECVSKIVRALLRSE